MAFRRPLVLAAGRMRELASADTLSVSAITGFTAQQDCAFLGVASFPSTSGYSYFNHDLFVGKHVGINDASFTLGFVFKGLAATDTAKFWATQQITLQLQATGTGGQSWGWRCGNSAAGIDGALQLVNLTSSVVPLTFDTSSNATLRRAVRYAGVISPSSISTSQNNYAPTDWANSAVVRINATADLSITGFAAPAADCDTKYLHMTGTGRVALADESASSTAANRIALAVPVTLRQDDVACIQYDAAAARWRVVGAAGAGTIAKQDDSALSLTGAATTTSQIRSTGDDTRLILSGNGAARAFSLNYSTAHDAWGTFTWQIRTTPDAFVSVVGGFNLQAGQWWFGPNAGAFTVSGALVTIGGQTSAANWCVRTTALSTVGATAAIDWTASAFVTMTLTSATNCTVSMTAPCNPCVLHLKVSAPASGTSPTLTWPASVRGAPPATVTLARYSVLQFVYDGTFYNYIGGTLNVAP